MSDIDEIESFFIMIIQLNIKKGYNFQNHGKRHFHKVTALYIFWFLRFIVTDLIKVIDLKRVLNHLTNNLSYLLPKIVTYSFLNVCKVQIYFC